MKLQTPSDGGVVVSIVKNAPRVILDADEVAQRDSTEAVIVEVENAQGLTARFWVSVAVKNGRPQVTVTTKPSKGGKQVAKSVTGTCNAL